MPLFVINFTSNLSGALIYNSRPADATLPPGPVYGHMGYGKPIA